MLVFFIALGWALVYATQAFPDLATLQTAFHFLYRPLPGQIKILINKQGFIPLEVFHLSNIFDQ